MYKLRKFMLLGMTVVLTFMIPGSELQKSAGSTKTDSVKDTIEFERITDEAKYTNNEVYVTYQDGSSNVITYKNKQALKDGLTKLKKKSNVDGFQPNYSYQSTGVVVKDADYSEQWALKNDGTFSVQDDLEFPIFSDPFADPMDPEDYFDEFLNDFYDFLNGEYSVNASTNKYHSIFEPVKAKKGIDINIEKAWADYNGGVRDTIVAIIDTGVDTNHEDLKDAIWVNTKEIPGDGIDNDKNGFVDDINGWNFYDDSNKVYVGKEDSHGTHGAGTIAASRNKIGIAGIVGSSHVKLMVLKALGGEDGTGSTASIIKAIDYAKKNGAKICNLSFGTYTPDSALKKAIADSGMLFIAAAGNGEGISGNGTNNDRHPIYPACYDLKNIISVANLSYTGKLSGTSNYGERTVDIAAPGTYIFSTIPEDNYGYMTGTSMAAPMVTGAAALLYSCDKNRTIDDVRTRLLSSSKKLDSLKGKVSTGGMLDVYAALTGKTTSETKETEKETGYSPVLSIQYVYIDGERCVELTVTDQDNDLKAVRYGAGQIKCSEFQNGKKYHKLQLKNHSTYFRIVHGGVYTFYAIDEAGHEVAKTVRIQ